MTKARTGRQGPQKANEGEDGSKKPEGRRRLGKKDLAQMLGISRPTLDGYLNRMEPPPPVRGKDGTFDVDEVAAYIAANGATPTSSEAIRKLRERLLRTQAEDAEVDLAERRGRLIDKATIEPGIAEIQAWWLAKLQAVFEGEIPRKLEGLTTVQRQALLAGAVDRVFREFKERMGALARGGRAA